MSSSTNDEALANVSWTPLLEQYFVETGERSQCLSILHSKASNHYSGKRTFIDIPVIVISSLTGFLSGASSALFPNNAGTASVLLGIASLFVSILNTVGSYYSFAKKAEGHRIASLSYAKLFRFIMVELSLPRTERIRATDLLKMVKTEIDRLSETSPYIPQSEIDRFKKLYNQPQYSNVARPYEANGLTKIKVFNEPPLLLLTSNQSSIADFQSPQLSIRVPINPPLTPIPPPPRHTTETNHSNSITDVPETS
jgi:hypothetical protein